MHEEHLMRDLRAKVDELSRTHGDARLVRARVALGPLAHLDAAGFRRLWAQTMAGGPGEMAAVEIETFDRLDDPASSSIVLRTVTFEEPERSAPRRSATSPAAGRKE